MSPALQETFMREIAPILAATVPRVIRPVGCEDSEELVQDAMAEACQAVDALERRRQPIIPKSVAHYAVQRLKSGRRSTSGGRTDVMSPGCRLDGKAHVVSLDEPLDRHANGTDDECLCFGDLIADRRDDPGVRAIREADWEGFIEELPERQRTVVLGTAAGLTGIEQAGRLGVTPPRIVQIRREVARNALRFWGDSVLTDVMVKPLWMRTRAA